MPLTVAAVSALAVPAMDIGSKVIGHISSRTGKAQLEKAKEYIEQGLTILRSGNGQFLHPAERRRFASDLATLAGRQRALVKQLDRINRGAARDHKADARDLVSKIEASSSEAAANVIRNESTRELEAMQGYQDAPRTQSVAQLQAQLEQALNAVRQAQAQATQALQAAQTEQAAQSNSNGVPSHSHSHSHSHDPIPTAPAQTHHHQSRSMQPTMQLTQKGTTATQSRSHPPHSTTTHAPAISQSMPQPHAQPGHYLFHSNFIAPSHHPDVAVSHRDRHPSHVQVPPPLNTSSTLHHPSGAQEPSDSHRERRSSRTTIPMSMLQNTSRTQDAPSHHRHHSSSRTQAPQVSPTRYTSSQAAPTTSYHEHSSNLMPSGSYTNSGNGYPDPTVSHGVNHPQSQYPQAQSQSQTGHRSRTRRTSIDGFGANLHHSRPRLDDDACSDSDIEAPEPRNHRPHRAHPAQGASYGQPSFSQGYVGPVPPPGFQIVGGQAHTGWLRQMPVSDYSNSAAQYPPSQYTVQQGWPGTSAPPGYPPYGGL